MPKPHLLLLAALLGAFGVSHFSDSIDPYYLDVLTGIGINVILAVSLNLVNGFTGQFSMGHAGFMAVGAYTSAFLSTRLGDFAPPLLLEPYSYFTFACLIILAGLMSFIMGYIVGLPSLRLKGDYLAIVTLGFGEII